MLLLFRLVDKKKAPLTLSDGKFFCITDDASSITCHWSLFSPDALSPWSKWVLQGAVWVFALDKWAVRDQELIPAPLCLRFDSQVAFLSSWSIISELQNGLGGHDDSSEVGSSVAITTTGHWTIHGCAYDGVAAAAALVVVSSPAVGLSPQFSSSFPRLTDY